MTSPEPAQQSPMTTTTTPPAPRKLGSLAMVWNYARRYPAQIAAAIVSLGVAVAATLAIPAGFQRVIDEGFGGEGRDIDQYFYYLFMIVVVLAIATAVRFYFVSWLGERTVADIRRAVQRNLLRQSPAFFEENRPSEIASRMTADTSVIEQVVGTTISVALRNAVMGIGGTAYLFTLAPRLTGMMLIAIPVIIMPIVLLGRKLQNIARASQDRVADVGAMTTEVLSAMKIVQGFGQEGREADRFAGAVERTFSTAKRRIAIRALMTSVVIGLLFGAIVALLWYGAGEVAAGRISGGTIAAFVLTGGLVAGAFGALTEVYGDLVRGAGAASRLAELLHTQPDIAPPANPLPLPGNGGGALRFEAVEFRYPSRPDMPALHDFSLAIAANETVAVVGPSGAGKSTLFQLAQRFYDPQAGRILLDDVDIRDADPADVRERIAVVPQETVVFAASARDNLRYGRWDASDEEIWAAADAANASEFLRALPDGLDTFLGEAGTRLSGGQRQRIAIARALLRQAPLLLLDEATSALDAESERLVQDALDRLMHQRTTIVIAHRLATVRAADRIVVMDDGRIVETGTHDQLVASGGLYARLASLQFNDGALSARPTDASTAA
jgi:ATP-binding cassette, subfamily B, bacterial